MFISYFHFISFVSIQLTDIRATSPQLAPGNRNKSKLFAANQSARCVRSSFYFRSLSMMVNFTFTLWVLLVFDLELGVKGERAACLAQ